jgi:Flp pilus assembly protein TadG
MWYRPTLKPAVPSPQASDRGPFRRRGAAIAEFAVVVPVLILLFFGLLEFGRMMMVEQILTNAAREGCRKAVLPGTTSDDVTTVVNNYLSNSGISGANTPTVTPAPDSANAGDAITVTVSINFNNVSWLPVPQWLGNKTISASVVMAKESNNT